MTGALIGVDQLKVADTVVLPGGPKQDGGAMGSHSVSPIATGPSFGWQSLNPQGGSINPGVPWYVWVGLVAAGLTIVGFFFRR